MISTVPRSRNFLVDTLRLAVAAAILGGLLGLAPLGVNEALAFETTHLRIGKQSYGATQNIELEVNKSMIVDLPSSVGEVVATQPGIATVVMRNKQRAIVQGVSGGDTNIFFMDQANRTITVLNLKISQPRSDVGNALEAALARVLPGSNLKVESVILNDTANRVVITGTVLSGDDLQKATQIAVQFAGDVENVANIATVVGSQQVMLQVTVAEVNREAVKQLGINLNGTAVIGGATLGLQNNPSLGGASNVITGNGFTAAGSIGGLTLSAQLRALERNSALRTLAEPNLTAISGQEAEFLAGGEFPVPTKVENGDVTYEFKEFGVRLKFTPTVKSNGIIGLIVDTKVSEPTTEGGFAVGGVTIPATKRREARTTVELGAGETLAIAGLMQDSVRQQINKLPGLGDIPILGALFRSRDFIHSQTELVILVTPYLAQANHGQPALPTDSMAIASDAEAIFLGRMETMYGVGPKGMRGSYNGSVGFVLD
ncbi:MAG TPA: type II and III secretion system protein family protein [Devosia sp.]